MNSFMFSVWVESVTELFKDWSFIKSLVKQSCRVLCERAVAVVYPVSYHSLFLISVTLPVKALGGVWSQYGPYKKVISP